jgi:hypothetical protein
MTAKKIVLKTGAWNLLSISADKTKRMKTNKSFPLKRSSLQGSLFLLVLLACCTGSLKGQNLENIGKGDIIGVSGGINANNVFYHANGVEGRRDPFNYFLSGNLNISIYDWNVPLSFSYSDQNSTFQQPFNQYGLSPTYKWLTLHAGYRSMSFSDYTVNGHLFLGGGFDITPMQKLKVSGFYGRLQKAVPEDTLRQDNVPAYKRMGGGIKVTLGDDKTFVDLIVFKAKDDALSLQTPPVASEIDPEENLVLGLSGGATLFKRLTFKGELSSSAITKDTRSEAVSTENIYNNLHFAFQPRSSSSYYQAYKASLQYAMENMGIGFAYDRVDPGYRTLGAYYFNNNLESFSLTNSAVLLQKKVRLNARVGVQRNNLNNDELNTMNRLSGSVNVNYLASPRLVYNVSYSNFKTVVNFRSQFRYLNQVSPYDNLDTLNYQQISQNASMNVNYVLNESKEKRQNINVNLTYQESADQQAAVAQPTGSKFYNFNSSYTVAFGERGMTLNIAANANLSRSIAANSTIFGPTASLRRTFLNKQVSTTATLSYNNSYLNSALGSRVTNFRLAANYTWKEKHQFDLNLTRLDRFSPQRESQQRFNELTVQFGYSYNFSLNK